MDSDSFFALVNSRFVPLAKTGRLTGRPKTVSSELWAAFAGVRPATSACHEIYSLARHKVASNQLVKKG
jgi:hypothetical protein